MRAVESFATRFGLVVSLLWIAPAAAETAQLQAVGRALERNREELSLYDWKARTEITVAGELLDVTLHQVAYDKSGSLREVPLDEDTGEARGGKKLNRKIRAFQGELEELTESYTELDPERMMRALSRAHAWDGQGERGESLRIQARGVVRQGDKLDLWVDTASKLPRRLEVLTSLHGEPVRLTTEFVDLDDGPTHAASIVVETELKEKKMLVRTENFDYVKRDR